ncbi:class IIb bacteriocin, lactobin A/cerein 7B family [Methylobacterium terricola]|uniref:Class IIb bacteriocin, lactobin A/cerein 7B family n=2 Tax=Methylobacterium terricola TaxID=2583531 RepID=A0A5C4L566_9HYPH|nr:class IIb bacteriocin, lactobin A/cerein 7B family [Methylobacterium terricola]
MTTDSAPPAFERQKETDELNLTELDEVNGGLIPLLVGAAYVGLVGYAFYRNYRH